MVEPDDGPILSLDDLPLYIVLRVNWQEYIYRRSRSQHDSLLAHLL